MRFRRVTSTALDRLRGQRSLHLAELPMKSLIRDNMDGLPSSDMVSHLQEEVLVSRSAPVAKAALEQL